MHSNHRPDEKDTIRGDRRSLWHRMLSDVGYVDSDIHFIVLRALASLVNCPNVLSLSLRLHCFSRLPRSISKLPVEVNLEEYEALRESCN